MRLLLVFLIVASGLFAEEYLTITLKGGEWTPPEGVESLKKGLKGRGLEIEAPASTKMDALLQAHFYSYQFGTGALKLTPTEKKDASVTLGGLSGVSENVYVGGKTCPPIVSVNLMGDIISVGVHQRAQEVYMHRGGLGKVQFLQALEQCIKLEPENEGGECIVSLAVTPRNTMGEVLNVLEMLQGAGVQRLLFSVDVNEPVESYPVELRFPGVVGNSMLDPRGRIDLRLEFDAADKLVSVFRDSGHKLHNGEQLRTYFAEKVKLSKESNSPAWLCLEGDPALLPYFAKPFAQAAAGSGVDFVICKSAGTKLRFEPVNVEGYVFSVDDLRLSEVAEHASRPVERVMRSWMGGAIEAYPMTVHVDRENYWVNGVEVMPSLKELSQRLEIYGNGAMVAHMKPCVVLYVAPNLPYSHLVKLLEEMRARDVDLTVVYHDWHGKAPNLEMELKRISDDFTYIEEYERLEQLFK